MQATAIRLIRAGQREISPCDVLTELDGSHGFDIPRPMASISGVLRNMPEFRRVRKNRYRYVA